MRRVIAGALAVAALLALPGSAGANHHFMVISEVKDETVVGDNSAFIELQMYSSGQNVVDGQRIDIYNSTGAVAGTSTFTADPQNGQNQRTILVGDDAVAGEDLTDSSLGGDINGAGGAACFESTVFPSPVDCVAWGSFTNTPMLPVGTAAPVIGVAQSLTRSIAPGCATLLEASDDTGDSATDFSLASPSPRPNSVAPTEQACGGGGGGGDNNPPQTEITKAPKRKIEKPKAKFKFTSSEPRSSFECKFDKGGFENCDSPEKYKRLDDGKHKFKVRATDEAGNTDPTPAKAKFKVVD